MRIGQRESRSVPQQKLESRVPESHSGIELMARQRLDRKRRNGSLSEPDGFYFPDLDATQQEALRSLRTILADLVLDGRQVNARAISIVDEGGVELAVVPLYDVLPAAVKRRPS